MENQSLGIMVLQSPAALTGPSQRIAWLVNTLTEIELEGTDLILLPELFLCGYNIGANQKQWAEHAEGPYAQQIAALCKSHHVAIHYGYAERDQGLLFNASNCFAKDGQKLVTHRKLILPPGTEKNYFSAGKRHTCFSLKGFRIGTLICYDVEFPENCRQLAKSGVDVILVPTALGAQWSVVAHQVIPTRAFENGVYICYANHAGSEQDLTYLGASCIIGPNGDELQRAAQDTQILKSALHKDQVKIAQKKLPYLDDLKLLPSAKQHAK